jgi:hypothetical protein
MLVTQRCIVLTLKLLVIRCCSISTVSTNASVLFTAPAASAARGSHEMRFVGRFFFFCVNVQSEPSFLFCGYPPITSLQGADIVQFSHVRACAPEIAGQ